MWLTADEGREVGGGRWRDVMNVRQDKGEWWCRVGWGRRHRRNMKYVFKCKAPAGFGRYCASLREC